MAGLLAVLPLGMFVWAGSDRLDLPFNAAPDETPFFSSLQAPATRGFPRQPHYWSRLIVSRWDAQHYIGFAIRGLTSCPTEPAKASDVDYAQCGLAWFPGYGIVARTIADTTGAAPDLVLMLMSCFAAFAINLLW